jgi:limonene-1,2-epoxide hydrolase
VAQDARLPSPLRNEIQHQYERRIDWEILRQTSSGTLESGTVLNERDDRVEIHGRWATLPVAGVFEIRNGKISLWRDYYDKQTIIDVMTPPAG